MIWGSLAHWWPHIQNNNNSILFQWKYNSEYYIALYSNKLAKMYNDNNDILRLTIL